MCDDMVSVVTYLVLKGEPGGGEVGRHNRLLALDLVSNFVSKTVCTMRLW